MDETRPINRHHHHHQNRYHRHHAYFEIPLRIQIRSFSTAIKISVLILNIWVIYTNHEWEIIREDFFVFLIWYRNFGKKRRERRKLSYFVFWYEWNIDWWNAKLFQMHNKRKHNWWQAGKSNKKNKHYIENINSTCIRIYRDSSDNIYCITLHRGSHLILISFELFWRTHKKHALHWLQKFTWKCSLWSSQYNDRVDDLFIAILE